MVRLVLALGSFLALLGCAASRPPVGLRGVPAERAVPAAGARAGSEIPLVPVPPPPLYKNDTGPRPTPAPGIPAQGVSRSAGNPAPIVPASGQGQVTPPPFRPAQPTATAPQPQPQAQPQFQPQPQSGVGNPIASTPNTEAAGLALEQVLAQAQARYAGIDSYVARLTRREVVGSTREPEEVVLFKFRKTPFSVYFKWLGQNRQGREVVYVQGRHDNKIHTLLAAGDIPLMPAGKRMSLSPDSIFVQSASRYPITRAGFGSALEHLVLVQSAISRGDTTRGRLVDLGLQNRPDYATGPLRVVEHLMPPGFEKPLPRGGKRVIGLSPENGMPVLIQTFDEKGREVEYYRYDRLLLGVGLDDLDFNPDHLWKKP